MRIALPTLPVTPREFLHKAGYGDHRDQHATKDSWTKRLGPDFYPRYHVYIEPQANGFVVDLHLDQKKPSYEGSSAHSGEYDGAAVEREAVRLKEVARQIGSAPATPSDLQKPKGFWSRLFGM